MHILYKLICAAELVTWAQLGVPANVFVNRVKDFHLKIREGTLYLKEGCPTLFALHDSKLPIKVKIAVYVLHFH